MIASPLRRLLALPLGETDAAAHRAVDERFPGVAAFWFDRRWFRRQPLRALKVLLARPYDDALLFAPDLRVPRLRLLSLLLLLPRARRRWLADDRGRIEPFDPAHHLRLELAPILRHLAACTLALVLARPLLALAATYLALEARLRLRRLPNRRPGRLLYLRSQFWFGLKGGGSVAHTAGVIGGLQESGVQVQVLASDRLDGVTAPLAVQPPERWFDGRLKEAEELAYNGPFLLAARRLARRSRPEALYQRYTAFNFGGAMLSRLLRLPFVLEFNSSDVWKAEHWGEFHLVGLARAAERVQLKAADRIVVVSQVLCDDLARTGVPPSKIVVNPNAVNPSIFRPDAPPEPLGLADDAVVAGFSGTFGVWHGIPTLAEALPLVARARPNVRFLLVGDGPLRPILDDAVAAHGLQAHTLLPGLVPHDRMPGYLAACDLLLAPHGKQADGGEFFGSPTKLYEYMAAGRAIIASAVGQMADVLRDGETALLVPPEDPQALANAIIRLADDPALRTRLGHAARSRAERHHTWRRNADRVLDALQSP